MFAFSLILGMTGVYVSSTFVRLEVFASIVVIVLASLGLTALIKEFFKNNLNEKKSVGKLIQLSFVSGIIILLIIPIVNPIGGDVFTMSKVPFTILNGGSLFPVSTTDWLDSMEWIKNNTPKQKIIELIYQQISFH